MRIPAQIRVRDYTPAPLRAVSAPRRRDLANELLAVVSSGTSALRAAAGAVRSGVTTLTREARADRAEPGSEPGTLSANVAALIYELLDAHHDTALLAEELGYDEDWQPHLDYLRALQRKGRELLASTSADDHARRHARRPGDRR